MTTRTEVERVADAVLYEGYLLYPYRPSSVKNRQRWTFGGVFPRVYSEAHEGTEPWFAQTECLLREETGARLSVCVRFLHLIERTAAEVLGDWPAVGEPPLRPVPVLRAGPRSYPTWQEATDRRLDLEALPVADLLAQPRRALIDLPAERRVGRVSGSDGTIAGALVRTSDSVTGEVEVSAVRVGPGLVRIRLRVSNLTPLADPQGMTRDDAVRSALVSTHAILHAEGGRFVSPTDPSAADCQNVGLWPVLAGEEGRAASVLAAPIILYDYPRVAPESPGDLFDATEIDEILTLRILTLTEQEKEEMIAADDRARHILERSESLAREQLLNLHGTIRGLRPLTKEGPS